MFSVFLYPDFNPIFLHVGPFSIRWYALAYIFGLVIGWRLMRHMVLRTPEVASPVHVDDFLTWATLGVVLGGRLGYVLFYQPVLYFTHPLQIFEVWDGGMSFHGGIIGVGVAIAIYCKRNGLPILGFADRIAVCAPIGLFLGRIANFINGELWGRPAPMWWPGTMVYPRAIPFTRPSPRVWAALHNTVCSGLTPATCIPRYPSELYEAFMEGIVLFVFLFLLSRSERIRARFGTLTAWFLIGYAIARITCEFFRAPDWFLRFLVVDYGVSMGQILSVPMFFAGIWLLWWIRREEPVRT